MSRERYSLINVELPQDAREGDKIIFDMPPFCSGEYEATIYRDKFFGLYINKDDAHFKGCRDYRLVKKKEDG